MSSEADAPEIKMDASNLYREEMYTDQKIGTLRVLIPVSVDGDPDPDRATTYVGSAQVLTPAGALPLSFEIQAGSLSEAIENYGPAAEKAFEETLEELKEMRRQQASSIVVPGGGGGMGPGGPGMGGGGPGPLQMP